MVICEKTLKSNECIYLNGNSLTVENVIKVSRNRFKAVLSDESINNMKISRNMVESLVSRKKVVYGITTGFGKFSNVHIDQEQTEQLQENLIISHAVGVGEYLPEEVVRAIMLLRANALAKGFSGIRPEIVQTLVNMINKGVHPAIPEKGSLGASGDLAPLAHMVLVMIGKGEAYYNEKLISGASAMEKAGIPIVRLKSKEGLALINGTQVMTAIGALAVYDALQLAATADITASMTCEALEGIPAAFDKKIQEVRPHQGQKIVAKNLRNLLEGSKIIAEAKHGRVQDSYSIRCIPQVHGATRDAIEYVKKVIEIELNSVTDNPILFSNEREVISGGNFHGQPIALAMDFLGMAMSELANISERRIEQLVNPALSNLPAFLTKEGGLNSGFMLEQYVAAALVSENKVLAHPACVDSIPSSANQEDHVSMGTIGARKCREIIKNVKYVLAIELLCAAQGIDLRGGEPAKATGVIFNKVRNEIPFVKKDREFRLDIKKAIKIIEEGVLVNTVRQAVPNFE
jgi:histidine ammonia-lyase